MEGRCPLEFSTYDASHGTSRSTWGSGLKSGSPTSFGAFTTLTGSTPAGRRLPGSSPAVYLGALAYSGARSFPDSDVSPDACVLYRG